MCRRFVTGLQSGVNFQFPFTINRSYTVRRVLSVTLLVAAFVTTRATAQFPQPSGFAVDDPVLRRIWAIETDTSQLPHLAQVLFDSPPPLLPPPPAPPPPTGGTADSWGKWATPSTADSMKARRTAAQQVWQQRLQRTGYVTGGGVAGAAGLSRRLEAAGVAGIVGSLWSQGWGVQKIFTAYTDRAPVLDIACEDYGLLYRLAENKQSPIIEVTAESQALGEVPVFNVVGEIKGSQLPNEYVMLSAHFHSWDGGSGATDNGTGTITMLEAIRVLKQVYPNPRRTILVGHWSGEEQGLNGSRGVVTDPPDVVTSVQ